MTGKEKRRFPRIPYREICHLEFLENDQNMVRDFESLHDISAGGVSLVTKRNVEIGTPLFLHFGAESKTPIQVKGKVVYTRKLDENRFLWGIQFVALTPEDQESLQNLLAKYGV
ncbi:MAG: PilZ domain-containing protein [Planctomycetota bacterium]|nr:MAG: PilZ domain-containing protein [Planctomycetota bacterium]